MTLILLFTSGMIALWAITLYNRLVRDRNRVQTAWSDIDIQLKRRFDLIPKLVAAVDQYAAYERATLTTLTELRSRTTQTADVSEIGALEGAIGNGLRTLLALAEAYPELKADGSFRQLQTELTEVENQIQYARRFYNGAVRNLNIRVESFPDLILARLFHYTRQPFFNLDAADQTTPPEIQH